MAEAAPAPKGHNKPPIADIWKEENLDLAKRLAAENGALKERKDKLLERAKKLPKAVKKAEDRGVISDYVKDIKILLKDAEAVRVATKAPVLDMGDIVDTLFKNFKKSLLESGTAVTALITAYDTEIDRLAKIELEKAAQKRRDEEDAARKAAEKALKGKNVEKAAEAVVAAKDASATREAAENAVENVDTVELTRSRGEKSASSTFDVWEGEIEDFENIDLNKLRKYITRKALSEAATRAGKDLEGNGIGLIKGLRIWSHKETRIT